MFDEQREFDARFEWGEAGLRRLAPHADVIVVVDVLSFATAVDIAVGRGGVIFPFSERGTAAADYARQLNALLAGDRSRDSVHPSYSLSPSSLQSLPQGTRLVLPSPNGARLTTIAAEYAGAVLLGCLRNASAVAASCRSRCGAVAVIAAGERWRDAPGWSGSLRPAVEDLIGAGAVLTALAPRRPSPEARAAMAAFQSVTSELLSYLAACASGRELIARGFAADLPIAADRDVSRAVPMLQHGRFIDAAGARAVD